MILYDEIISIRDRLNKIIDMLETDEKPSEMNLDQFSEYIGDKERALVLAKKCNIGHSVFYDIVDGVRRSMRAGTKARIRESLGIEVKQ